MLKIVHLSCFDTKEIQFTTTTIAKNMVDHIDIFETLS